MRVPHLTAAVPDMIIAALRSSGIIADDSSADAIRSVDANITEKNRDDLAASLNYGSSGGGGGTSSTEDVNIFIDSDDTNSTTPYENYFRVAHGQNTVPVLPEHEMFTLRYNSDTPTSYHAALGPDPTTLSAGDDYSARLTIGSGGPANPDYYFNIQNVTSLVTAVQASGVLQFETANHPDIAVGNVEWRLGSGTFAVTNIGGARARFGVYDVNNWTRIFVGENPGVGDDQFNIEETLGVTRMRHGDTSQERTLIISGSYPDISTDPRVRVAIGGASGTQNLDPRDLLIGGGYPDTTWYPAQPHEATFMTVSPALNERRAALHTWHRATVPPEDTHLVNFHSNINMIDGSVSTRVRLLSCTGFNGTNREIAFEVRSDRTAYCGGIFSTSGQDVGENFFAVGDTAEYTPGTVMKANLSGKVLASDSYADTAVVGVVSTKPGYLLGGTPAEVDASLDRVILGMAGTVPTNVTTEYGDILVGTLLVSAPNGMAGKAPADAEPGTVIGKALQSLEQGGEETKTGTIKMLILNR